MRARARAAKGARLLRTPAYWTPLRQGVAASVEHEGVPFDPDTRTVIDVGASRGQFGLFAARTFTKARLVCFEPLAAPRAMLESVMPADRTTIHPLAIGGARSTEQIHVSAADDSSSLLPIGRGQVEAFPGTQEERTEEVRVERLDDVLTQPIERPALLKIDVQGYELEALRGADETLGHVDAIYVECSFTELYDGQPLADEVVCHLRDRGFRLAGVYGVARTPAGACLQADFLFRRAAG